MKKSSIPRILAALLALLTVAMLAVSCAETPEQPEESGTVPVEQTEGETLVTNHLPDMDMDGYEYSIVCWEVNSWGVHYNMDLYSESITGDPINDVVYQRNERLKEKYNFEITYESLESTELTAKIRQLFTANNDVYDLIYVLSNEVSGLVLDGAFLDFETSFEYCDLDQPYWDQDIRKELSFSDHTYQMASSYNISDEDATSSIVFNKTIARDNELENFYELAESGAWTFDAMLDNMTAFDGDENGDGKMKHGTDTFGFIGGDDVAITLFFGGGARLTEKDEYDLPEDVFSSDLTFDVFDGIRDVMYDPSFLNHHTVVLSDIDTRKLFIDGDGLFYWTRMDDIRAMRGEEGIDFGILPVPKYEEAQDRYICHISKWTNGFMSVLNCEENPDYVGFIMEAMASASYYPLTEAYYEMTLKYKSTRDDESQSMLDIIVNNRTVDIGDIFNFGGFAEIVLRFGNGSTPTNMASTYAQYQGKIATDIVKFIDKVDLLDANS